MLRYHDVGLLVCLNLVTESQGGRPYIGPVCFREWVTRGAFERTQLRGRVPDFPPSSSTFHVSCRGRPANARRTRSVWRAVFAFAAQTRRRRGNKQALWEAVDQIQLDENREDNIYWRWTADGEYTTKSAYSIQFQGIFSKLKLMLI